MCKGSTLKYKYQLSNNLYETSNMLLMISGILHSGLGPLVQEGY